MNHDLSRRRFLKHSALLAAAAFSGVSASGLKRSLGVQLYTLRNLLPEKADDVLRSVSEIGFQEVEVLSQNMKILFPYLQKYSLDPVSGHFPVHLVTDSGAADSQKSKLEHAIEEASEVGLRYMVIPWIDFAERGDADFFRRFADQMNTAGERIRKAGMQLCYHNHAFEFGPPETGGKTTIMEILMSRFQGDLVGIELDVFWAAAAGVNPVELLRSAPGRFPLLHLKDKAQGIGPLYLESEVPPEAFLEVGAGELDFAAILEAAEAARVRHLFVEQDHTPGDPLESLRKSYQYLRSLEG